MKTQLKKISLSFGLIVARLLARLLKYSLVFVAAVALFIVLFVGAFFATPEFYLPTTQLRNAIHKYAPESVDLAFADFEVKIVRPKDLFFSKTISVYAKAFCVRYEGEAVNACFDEISLGLTGGWSGPREADQPWYMPSLNTIDPIRMLDGVVTVDLPKLPPSDPNEPKSDFDAIDFLRRKILPVWKLDGSLVQLDPLTIITGPGAGFLARFHLTTGDDGDTLRAALSEFRALDSQLNANALIRLTRPQDWIGSPTPVNQPEVKQAWKLWANGVVNLNRTQSIRLDADSSIFDWKTLDFRIGTKWKGISALREARLDGSLKQPILNSRFSLKMGSYGAGVRALDFANCALSADLEKKIGGLACGPQTVRLQLTERSLIRDPKFFTLHPSFEIKATNLNFGDTKSADFEVALRLAHMNFATIETVGRGQVSQGPGDAPLRYGVEGNLAVGVSKLQRIVKLFDRTPFEVPAPFNVLDGQVKLEADVQYNQDGGGVQYRAGTLLDSEYQSVHLRLDGKTDLRRVAGELTPWTQAELAIDSLRLSVPRYDILAKPPAFAPDGRFGPIAPGAFKDPPVLPKTAETKPMNLRFRTYTTSPDSIQLATNLTKAPIPVALDVTYEQKATSQVPDDLPPLPLKMRGPATDGIRLSETRAKIERPKQQVQTPVQATVKAPAVTGWVNVGQTPVELFRREATVQQVRVDLLADGNQRLNGLVQINYLDYDINVLLLGTTSQPAVKLTSDPPLSDAHILGLLLYGRAPSELSTDEESSVGSVRAAMANATLGISSLYLLASTPIESVGYDPVRDVVTAKVGLGGGASLELGGNTETAAAGFNKRLSKEFVFRSEVESLGVSGQKTISALIEWVKRF